MSVRFNCITDVGISKIAQVVALHTGMESIDVSSNHLTSSGAKAICCSILLNKKLKRVVMVDCDHRDSFVLGDLISQTLSIESLDLACNAISSAGASCIAQAIQKKQLITLVCYH